MRQEVEAKTPTFVKFLKIARRYKEEASAWLKYEAGDVRTLYANIC